MFTSAVHLFRPDRATVAIDMPWEPLNLDRTDAATVRTIEKHERERRGDTDAADNCRKYTHRSVVRLSGLSRNATRLCRSLEAPAGRLRHFNDLQAANRMALLLITAGPKTEVLMPNHEPHWGFNKQPTDQDVTGFTPTFIALAAYDDNDGQLGCEAIIGELISRGSWQK